MRLLGNIGVFIFVFLTVVVMAAIPAKCEETISQVKSEKPQKEYVLKDFNFDDGSRWEMYFFKQTGNFCDPKEYHSNLYTDNVELLKEMKDAWLLKPIPYRFVSMDGCPSAINFVKDGDVLHRLTVDFDSGELNYISYRTEGYYFSSENILPYYSRMKPAYHYALSFDDVAFARKAYDVLKSDKSVIILSSINWYDRKWL
ncbi:MAG: hypothetical protein GY804_03205 [Alphaproteobacteria bacterium]|nr:hypothetical protein [Alphaproteobacteria bacterium]